eukprot:Lankesteria_metandrocarpae@DN4991_c0_g1_i1.p2
MSSLDQNAIEEVFQRIKSHKGVLGVAVATQEGRPVNSTFDTTTTNSYCSMVVPLAKAVSENVTENGADELKYFQMRTQKKDVMVVPSHGFNLIVVREPEGERSSTDKKKK